jgi:DNA-binding NtrC family response regulator
MFRLELLWRNFEIKRSHKALNSVLEQKLISLEKQHRVRLNKEVLEKLTLDDIRYDVIQQHLHYYKNNVQDVANKLKIGKSTIYRLIRENKV